MPKWAQPVSKLREYARGRKAKMKGGGRFRVVFTGSTGPVGELWHRPHMLRWDEGSQILCGHFLFGQSWATLNHYPGLGAFVFDAPADMLGYVMSDEAKYYTVKERAKIAIKLEEGLWQSEEKPQKANANA